MGRVPVIVTLHSLDEEALVRILREPKNALIKQFVKLLEMDGVTLEFEEEAVRAIAKVAMERNTGARGLRAILENIMLEIMFQVPSRADVKKCIITKDTVKNSTTPILILSDSQSKKLPAPKQKKESVS